MRSSKQRSRSKSNRPRMMGNITNRVFDSSGPDGKVRGTPQQIIEKYLFLARDAQLANDRVVAEGFLQHAEHYTRMLGEAQREIEARREGGEGSGGQNDSGDQPGGQNDAADRQGDQGGRQHSDRPQAEQGQTERYRNDRNQNDRNQNDRGRKDRNRGDRPRDTRGSEDRDQRLPHSALQSGHASPDPDRGQGPARQGREETRQPMGNGETGADRGRQERSSFDEVIDLQETTGEDAGLIETPESRRHADAGPDAGTGEPPAPGQEPAKPARRRSAAPRKPRKATGDGGAAESDETGSTPDRASAAE